MGAWVEKMNADEVDERQQNMRTSARRGSVGRAMRMEKMKQLKMWRETHMEKEKDMEEEAIRQAKKELRTIRRERCDATMRAIETIRVAKEDLVEHRWLRRERVSSHQSWTLTPNPGWLKLTPNPDVVKRTEEETEKKKKKKQTDTERKKTKKTHTRDEHGCLRPEMRTQTVKERISTMMDEK